MDPQLGPVMPETRQLIKENLKMLILWQILYIPVDLLN